MLDGNSGADCSGSGIGDLFDRKTEHVRYYLDTVEQSANTCFLHENEEEVGKKQAPAFDLSS